MVCEIDFFYLWGQGRTTLSADTFLKNMTMICCKVNSSGELLWNLHSYLNSNSKRFVKLQRRFYIQLGGN